jgi:hypothetical protein
MGSQPTSGPYINVRFDWGPESVTGRYQPYADAYNHLARADLTIYMGAGGCIVGSPQKCFDESQPGYFDGVVNTLLHEFGHALRATDSSMANVMGPFQGVNNILNRNPDLDCIFNRLKPEYQPIGGPCT